MNQIAIIGLGTMGASIARNFARNAIKTAVYNRTSQITDEFLKEHQHEGPLTGYSDLNQLVASMEVPRKFLILVTAGEATDAIITQLTPLLDPGDIIIDGGNTNYKDTIRRSNTLKEHQIEFIGCGISGGEKGALEGPSIMPGGTLESLQHILPLFQKIAAKDFSNQPCIHPFIGIGSGNFIKTIHNGIEYAIMQIFADTYEILRKIYKLSPSQIAEIFTKFTSTELNGFLLDTAIQVLQKPDSFHPEKPLLDYISDHAGAKGTGTWTAQSALEYNIPVPTILAALHSRQLSADPEERKRLSEVLNNPPENPSTNLPENSPAIPLEHFTEILTNAVWLSVYCSYLQGIELLETAVAENNWQANSKDYLRVWEGGCIIRSEMLKILPANKYQDLYHQKLKLGLPALGKVLAQTYGFGIATPCLSASFDYLSYKTTSNLPTNLVQGMRDCFGAHTYMRTDQDGTFTENWD